MKGDRGESMYFEIRCRDGQSYAIRFSRKTAVQMIEVAPAMCQIESFVFESPILSEVGPKRESASFRLLSNELVEPGGVYYVGDFIVNLTSDTLIPFFEWKQRWKFGASRNDYQGASAELRQIFPSFSAVPTEDRSNISRVAAKGD